MAKKKKTKANVGSRIAQNKKARYDYAIEENFEAGLSLLGWEIKSIRDGRIQMGESYVFIRDGELWWFGASITPLTTASTHVNTDPFRNRKLLMHRKEINRLIGKLDIQGFTLVPLSIYWKNGKVKMDVGLAKGKTTHDKRNTEKDRDWQRDKQRILKDSR